MFFPAMRNKVNDQMRERWLWLDAVKRKKNDGGGDKEESRAPKRSKTGKGGNKGDAATRKTQREGFARAERTNIKRRKQQREWSSLLTNGYPGEKRLTLIAFEASKSLICQHYQETALN